MQIVLASEIDSLPITESVASVGNFDGVHRGHDLLIRDVKTRAQALHYKSVIVTFEPHTRAVLFPDAPQPILSTFEEKTILMQHYGVDYLICLPFDRSIAEMPAEAFVKNIMVRKLKARQWVMGEGHAFGKNQSGSKNFPHTSKGKNDIYMITAQPMILNGRVISSTEIRLNIVEGRIEDAVMMLGHPYLLVSQRISGLKKGTQLGYPTLNFTSPPSSKVLPPPGIYAAEVEFGERRWKGALYFGDCPTFGNRDRHFEFHAFDFSGIEPREGASANLWLHSRVRADRAFKDAAELTASIKRDIENITYFFSQEKEQCQ
jgi:riboflavin kinase/FMN adenylyltransferase